ncbi:MAG: lytic transglycosylase domain-containing protein [Pseudomonadota bacterium]|nr:lytic transglycosylase domain-containing protein [Pseudomonadota bacterium]
MPIDILKVIRSGFFCHLFAGCLGISLFVFTGGAAAEQNLGRCDIQRMVIWEARSVGISPALALAVAHVESNFNPTAKSHKGAVGVMQIMPATSRYAYNFKDPEEPWKPRTNIVIGLHYLKKLLFRYKGRKDLALSFYNGGSAVDRYGQHRPRVIPFTRPYVTKVTDLISQYEEKLQRGTLGSCRVKADEKKHVEARIIPAEKRLPRSKSLASVSNGFMSLSDRRRELIRLADEMEQAHAQTLGSSEDNSNERAWQE